MNEFQTVLIILNVIQELACMKYTFANNTENRHDYTMGACDFVLFVFYMYMYMYICSPLIPRHVHVTALKWKQTLLASYRD